MVLYYAMTNYHIICCWLHKIKYNSNESASLIISEVNVMGETIKQRIEASGVFQHVYLYTDQQLKEKRPGRLGKNASPEQVEKETEAYCKVIEHSLPVDPRSFRQINIALDHWPLGIYLIHNHIPYNFFEDGAGLLGSPDYLADLVKRVDIYMYLMAKHNQCFGYNEVVHSAYASIADQSVALTLQNAENFSVSDLLLSLNESEMKALLAIFAAPPKKSIPENVKTALLLTQPYVSYGWMDMSEQTYFYRLLVDYFANDAQLFVKAHPTDIHLDYTKVFPGSSVFHQFMPSELLPYCIDKSKFDVGITACSTAIWGLKRNMDKIVTFTPQIEKTYVDMHKYYALAVVLKHVDVMNRTIKCIGTNIEQLTMMCGVCWDEKEGKEIPAFTAIEKFPEKQKKMLIVGALDDDSIGTYRDYLRSLHGDMVLIDLNSGDKFSFFHETHVDNMDNMHPITVEKRDLHNGRTAGKDDEIFVFTQSQKIKEALLGMKDEKQLRHLGIKISIDQNSSLELKKAQAMIHALESRILALIAENNALKRSAAEEKTDKKRKK